MVYWYFKTMSKKKSSKSKSGVWFKKVRGSYLPASPMGVLMHGILFLASLLVIATSMNSDLPIITITATLLLQLIGLGAIFTWIASQKA